MKNSLYVFLIIFTIFLLLCTSCQEVPVVLNFAFGPEEVNTVEPLIHQFNEENKGKIKVNWIVGSKSSNEFYQTIKEELLSEKPSIDIFGADVTWTASLGKDDLVADISSLFHNLYSPKDFIPAAMNSAVYKTRVLALPWFTDIGMLYYRKDLLDKYGFEAPTTWEEIATIVHNIKSQESIPYGFVFQGDNYEGGIANACEFIWNAGGDISISNLSVSGAFENIYFNPSLITVYSKASEIGFAQAKSLIESGITPEHVHTFREQEALYSFYYGGSIFMRGWPSAYGIFTKSDASLTIDKVGVTTIPKMKASSSSFSCLGGWNLMMAKRLDEDKKDAAWKFMKYMVAEEQQSYRTIAGASLPTLYRLYYDEELLSEAPILEIGAELVQYARNRPVSPHYMEYAPEISNMFHQILKGGVTPELGVFELQQRLESIQSNNIIAQN